GLVGRARIQWGNQFGRRGFGAAVMRAEEFVASEAFLLHAGDNFFLSKNRDHLKRLVDAGVSLRPNALFLVQSVKDPQFYGVVEAIGETNGLIRGKRLIDEPESPASNLGIM